MCIERKCVIMAKNVLKKKNKKLIQCIIITDYMTVSRKQIDQRKYTENVERNLCIYKDLDYDSGHISNYSQFCYNACFYNMTLFQYN